MFPKGKRGRLERENSLVKAETSPPSTFPTTPYAEEEGLNKLEHKVHKGIAKDDNFMLHIVPCALREEGRMKAPCCVTVPCFFFKRQKILAFPKCASLFRSTIHCSKVCFS